MKRANLTVPEKLKMQREGYKFFCEHHKTANCAIGENMGLTCVHAPNHKTREGCRYWKPVHIERKDELICLRADLAAVTAERDRMLISAEIDGGLADECRSCGCQHESWKAHYAAVTAERDRVREALLDTTASLVASVSLLERGGKKAAPSDTMFAQMLVDYKNSIDRARAALEGLTEKSGAGNE